VINDQSGRKDGVMHSDKILKVITIIIDTVIPAKRSLNCRPNPCQRLICDAAANRNIATQTISLQHLPRLYLQPIR